MGQRRVSLGLWLAFALLLAAMMPSAADTAKPRAILALLEPSRISLNQGPLPEGLRFVLYDDGEIITQVAPTQANPDPPGRGVTFGRLDPAAAESLRREAATDLQQVAAAVSGYPGFADVGSTIVEVWDGERMRAARAYAWPCQAEGRDFTKNPWKRARDLSDPHFLKVCDHLLQFRIPEPAPWSPQAAQIMISAIDPATAAQQIPWPKDWPAPPALAPKAATPLCVPVSTGDFSGTLATGRLSEIGGTALIIDQANAAVIWDWYFDLPAEIPIANDKGEIDHVVGASCS